MSKGNDARAALAVELEQHLTDPQLVVWQTLAGLLPVPSDYAIEIFLLEHVIAGWPIERLRRYIPNVSYQLPLRPTVEQLEISDHGQEQEERRST